MSKTLWVRKPTPREQVAGGLPLWSYYEASSSEIIKAALTDFPTDEDVEVAARAVARVRGASWDTMLSVAQNVARGDARAALQAIADARRTEEETNNEG